MDLTKVQGWMPIIYSHPSPSKRPVSGTATPYRKKNFKKINTMNKNVQNRSFTTKPPTLPRSAAAGQTVRRRRRLTPSLVCSCRRSRGVVCGATWMKIRTCANRRVARDPLVPFRAFPAAAPFPQQCRHRTNNRTGKIRHSDKFLRPPAADNRKLWNETKLHVSLATIFLLKKTSLGQKR